MYDILAINLIFVVKMPLYCLESQYLRFKYSFFIKNVIFRVKKLEIINFIYRFVNITSCFFNF